MFLVGSRKTALLIFLGHCMICAAYLNSPRKRTVAKSVKTIEFNMQPSGGLRTSYYLLAMAFVCHILDESRSLGHQKLSGVKFQRIIEQIRSL